MAPNIQRRRTQRLRAEHSLTGRDRRGLAQRRIRSDADRRSRFWPVATSAAGRGRAPAPAVARQRYGGTKAGRGRGVVPVQARHRPVERRPAVGSVRWAAAAGPYPSRRPSQNRRAPAERRNGRGGPGRTAPLRTRTARTPARGDRIRPPETPSACHEGTAQTQPPGVIRTTERSSRAPEFAGLSTITGNPHSRSWKFPTPGVSEIEL
jgi:hypothetical protein